jgi:prolyl oligopeptidase
VYVQRPDLFHAVLCEVPLLDMLRYHLLLAGASWVGEYGNPDVAADREFISKYSPYQNLKANGQYPEVFFLTSTKDDRVHPGHARKMVARMREFGYPVYYYENTEGGHGGAANQEQRILWSSLEFTYLWKKLSLPSK